METGILYLAKSRIRGNSVSIGKEMTASKFSGLNPSYARFKDSQYFCHVGSPCSLFESGHDDSIISIRFKYRESSKRDCKTRQADVDRDHPASVLPQ